MITQTQKEFIGLMLDQQAVTERVIPIRKVVAGINVKYIPEEYLLEIKETFLAKHSNYKAINTDKTSSLFYGLTFVKEN